MSTVLEMISRYIRPCGESEMIDEILGPFRRSVAGGDIPLVLFCAGSSGKIIHSLLLRYDIPVACFCDNNARRVGGRFCERPVISFRDLTQHHRESIILIASTAYQHAIQKQLLEARFPAEKILTLDADESTFDARLKRERLQMYARNGDPATIIDELRHDQERISDAFRLLADDKSRALFVRRLGLIASGYEFQTYRAYLQAFSEPVISYGYDNRDRLTIGGSFFYFNNDVYQLHDDEVMVDGGAYTGDSVDAFVAACDNYGVRYRHIHCFEPDDDNFLALKDHTSGYRDVTCWPLGLWSHHDRLRFVSSAQIESYGARIHQTSKAAQASPDVVIEADSIDARLSNQPITLIKLDIEGAEKEAIQGAAGAITAHKPKLALSVYHNTGDLYEIPLQVHRLDPDYHMYLRHFGNYFDDLVLLAVQP